MEQLGIDKIQQTIEDIIEVVPDVESALESDDKITWAEGGMLVIQHGGKVVRFFGSIVTIGKQIIDIDSEEATKLFEQLQSHFGGTDDVKAAIKKIISGAANVSQGIQELIASKK